MLSEKVTPELAKCYDEIDQIYDYIRGLVPLPPQLRKIKSIDFEQLERDKKLLEQQQIDKQQQIQPRSGKPRQRQANDGASDQLKSPQESRVDQPRALKLTLSSGVHRPTVKRVESLNLGSNQSGGAQVQLARPAFLIGGQLRSQQFRLPRAHSTSTLARPTGDKTRNESCTLPALRSSGQSGQTRKSGHMSLGRARGQHGSATPPVRPSSSKLQSVESYIDEHSQSGSSLSSLSNNHARTSTSPGSSSSSSKSSGSSASKSRSASASASTTTTSTGTAKSQDSEGTATTRSSDRVVRGNRPSSKDELGNIESSRTPRWMGDNGKSEVQSDYENDDQDETSDRGSGGASLSDLLTAGYSAKLSKRSQQVGKQPSNRQPSREHIYEQIPAHRAAAGASGVSQQSTSRRAGTAPKPDASATAQVSRLQAKQQAPFNYPIAFAPNVAAKAHHHHQGRSSSLKPGQAAGYTSRAYLAPTARAPSMHNLSATPTPIYLQPFSQSPAAPMRAHLAYQRPVNYMMRPMRPLSDHRHRLSIGNLHHLIAAHPLLSAHLAPPPVHSSGSLARSTQSAGKQHSRAPRFSPADLIAKIQVPRAVSKRQVQPPIAAQVWQHPTANRAIRSGCPSGSQAQQGRNSGRRLTAIGIEHTLAATTCEVPESQEESARAKAEAFMRTRCQNSISDLHSASQSGSSDLCTPPTNLSKSSADNTSLSDEDEPIRVGAQQTSDEGNFVSSRSFIKCYYGRERPTKPRASCPDRTSSPVSKTVPLTAESHTTKEDTQWPNQQVESSRNENATKAKRRTSRLLNLIGLNRLVESTAEKWPLVSARRKSDGQVDELPRRAQAEPKAKLVGEFLNEEGPILVRDRRILAVRPELVCHFEHPTVQVSKITAKRQLDPGSSVTLASTDTSNSTSSYEAAIKHGGERAAQLLQTEPNRSLEKVKRQQATSSSLIRVPKLSRQSHLLNRPLPKPPVSHQRRSACDGTASLSHRQQPSQRRQAAEQGLARWTGAAPSSPAVSSPAQTRQLPAAHTSKPTPTVTSKRPAMSPLAVSISNHQPSPTVTTCTSSGISSRMTTVAPTSGASNASSLASTRAPGRESSR